jgi:hypothetical protein
VSPSSVPDFDDFFDLDLLQNGFVLLLAFLVLELAVVHDFGYGRLRRRRNLYQVQLSFLCLPQGIVNLDDAELLAFHTDQTHFWRCNFTIDACLLLFCRDELFSKSKPDALRRGKKAKP